MGYGDLDLLPVKDIPERQIDVVPEGLSRPGASAVLLSEASSAEERSEQISEDIADIVLVGEVVPAETSAAELSVDACVAVLVVQAALVGV